MLMDGQGTKFLRKIAENYNRLSRVDERYRRQTTDGRVSAYIANVLLVQINSVFSGVTPSEASTPIRLQWSVANCGTSFCRADAFP